MARHYLSEEHAVRDQGLGAESRVYNLREELKNDQGATKQQLEELARVPDRQRSASLWIIGLILGLSIPLSYLIISLLGALISNP